MRRWLPIVGVWAGLACVLSVLTTRVVDWFAMPNELLYERRAISVARSLSPLPRLREEFVSTFDQLYPVLVSPAFRWGYVPNDLWSAHFLNAWIMSSAAIPAFLLARRVTGRAWTAYAVAVLAVAMPWILLASFLFTEVAAYPAFLWAVLAMQASVAAPSRRHDLLALLAIAIAFLGRTQLALLLVLFPIVILAFELGRPGRGLKLGLRASLQGHRLLAAVYAALVAAGAALAAAGRLPDVLGVYSATIGGKGASIGERVVPSGIGSSFVEHVATFALGLGILPVVVGVAWLLANLVRPPAGSEAHAFACLGSVAVAGIFLEVTIFDLRFGERFVHDRYLLYLVPLIVLGLFCAVIDPRPPRWSLLLPAGLVAAGYAADPLAALTGPERQINSDAPIAVLYDPVVRLAGSDSAARVALVVATLVLALLFVQATFLLRPARLLVVVAVLALVGIPSITGYMFVRLFETYSWSNRPLTHRVPPHHDWIDRTVGPEARVAIAPYPVSPDYFVNQQLWRDYEFWNKSVTRDIEDPARTFRYTGDTFIKTYPRFDPATGQSNISPTPYVLQATQDSRFRVSGGILVHHGDTMLIDAGRHWRLEWLSSGLEADGWTRPGVMARIRVFAPPGQRGSVVRFLTLAMRAPGGAPERPITIRSNLATLGTRKLEDRITIRVCVPPRGFATVGLRVKGASPIPGNLQDPSYFSVPREGGVFLHEIALADETGGRCG